MENKFKIASLDRGILDQCVDLFIDIFSREPWNDVYDSRDQVISLFQNHMNNNYFLGYVLKKEEEIVALSIGAKKPWIKGMEYYIDQFCVKEDLQGKGIGSLFLRLIESEIEIQGVSAIILNTEKGFPSEKFYLTNGFKPLDEVVFLVK